MLDIGVVGGGTMGTDHVRTLLAHVPGARVRAVYDAATSRAADLARLTGARGAASGEELIGSDDVGAVIIASPDATHVPLALAAIAAGKPVLCEKPLGVGPAQSAQVVAAELAAGRRLVSVGFMRRFDPAYRALRTAVRDGVVGEPLLVHNVHRNAHPHPDATSEGVVANSMVHELDILPWLLGSPIVEVHVRSPRAARLGESGLRDPQLATVALASGVLATIEVFLAAGYGYDVRCEVVGSRGAVSLRAPGHLAVATGGLSGTTVPADFRGRFADAYRDELVAWVAAASRGGAVGASAWDGHQANLAAAAGIASLRDGGAVRVEDVDATVPELYRA